MFGGQCFCATQHFVPPLNNHVVPKKCPGMHTDSMQIFNKLQIEENNLIFSSPNFAVVCFRCQTWFHYLQLKAFKRSRSNNLNLKKEIISNAKPTQASLDQDTIQVYYNSGHSCNLFHLSDKKESRFFSPQKQSNYEEFKSKPISRLPPPLPATSRPQLPLQTISRLPLPLLAISR